MNPCLRRLALAVLLAAPLAAWAQGDPPPAHRHGPPGALFISPCGRPYRSGPGEPYPVAAWFAEADANHDGFLDRAEFRADATRFFAILDRNHDGVIDTDEVALYERTMAPEILRGQRAREAETEGRIILAQFGGGGGGSGGGGHGGGRHGGSHPPASTAPQADSEMVGAVPYNLLAEPEPVTAADTEFNERITLAEFLAAADRRFDALDVKGKGQIALADLPRTAVQRGPGHGPRHPA